MTLGHASHLLSLRLALHRWTAGTRVITFGAARAMLSCCVAQRRVLRLWRSFTTASTYSSTIFHRAAYLIHATRARRELHALWGSCTRSAIICSLIRVLTATAAWFQTRAGLQRWRRRARRLAFVALLLVFRLVSTLVARLHTWVRFVRRAVLLRAAIQSYVHTSLRLGLRAFALRTCMMEHRCAGFAVSQPVLPVGFTIVTTTSPVRRARTAPATHLCCEQLPFFHMHFIQCLLSFAALRGQCWLLQSCSLLTQHGERCVHGNDQAEWYTEQCTARKTALNHRQMTERDTEEEMSVVLDPRTPVKKQENVPLASNGHRAPSIRHLASISRSEEQTCSDMVLEGCPQLARRAVLGHAFNLLCIYAYSQPSRHA